MIVLLRCPKAEIQGNFLVCVTEPRMEAEREMGMYPLAALSA